MHGFNGLMNQYVTVAKSLGEIKQLSIQTDKVTNTVKVTEKKHKKQQSKQNSAKFWRHQSHQVSQSFTT